MTPSNRTLALLIVPLLLAVLFLPVYILRLAGDILPGETLTILIFTGIYGSILAAFLLDGFFIPGKSRLTARRTTDRVFSIGYSHRVELEIFLKKGIINSFRARAQDDFGPNMQCDQLPADLILRIGGNRIKYRLRVHLRGNHTFTLVWLTLFSPLGLAKKVIRIPCKTEIMVYPDLKAVSRYLILARKSHLGLLGIRRAARAGGDNEFERLREYQHDDEYRHIDWKASAKHSRLIVRTYQMSQNQTIIFMLDCGRMMTAEVNGRSLLDYALSSILLLARVALSRGDRVGLLAFAGRVLRYVKPAAGARHHSALIQASYNIFPVHEESNFDPAFHYLNNVNRKRSLVCMVTNVIDEMNAAQISSYLGSLSGRHLPFAVLLKARDIHELMERKPTTVNEMYTQAAAADFLLWKRAVIQGLKNQGTLTMEAFPDQLDAALINEYLAIKAKKLL